MLVGSYHLARPDNGNSPMDEAANFLTQASAYIGNGYLLPILDLEADYVSDYETEFPDGDLSAWVRTWMNFVQAKTGIMPILYTSKSVLFTDLDADLANYPLLWIADPASVPNPSGTPSYIGMTWTNWQFKQYQDQTTGGSCPGITGPADLDSFNGDMTQLTALTYYPPIVRLSGIGWTSLQPPAGGAFAFQIFSPTLQSATVQASVDLSSWINIGTVTIGANRVGYFSDSNAGTFFGRFYRVMY
jgi:hypothetical protein